MVYFAHKVLGCPEWKISCSLSAKFEQGHLHNGKTHFCEIWNAHNYIGVFRWNGPEKQFCYVREKSLEHQEKNFKQKKNPSLIHTEATRRTNGANCKSVHFGFVFQVLLFKWISLRKCLHHEESENVFQCFATKTGKKITKIPINTARRSAQCHPGCIRAFSENESAFVEPNPLDFAFPFQQKPREIFRTRTEVQNHLCAAHPLNRTLGKSTTKKVVANSQFCVAPSLSFCSESFYPNDPARQAASSFFSDFSLVVG